jgi:hypothetical protein
MIFIADLTPPPALCPHINGSAVLKSDNKLSRKTKCQRYVSLRVDQDARQTVLTELVGQCSELVGVL